MGSEFWESCSYLATELSVGLDPLLFHNFFCEKHWFCHNLGIPKTKQKFRFVIGPSESAYLRILPNSRFNQDLEGSIFAWLFGRRDADTIQTRTNTSQSRSDHTEQGKTRPDQTRPELLDTMVDLPYTMVDLPDIMVVLPGTMVDPPFTMVDLPGTMVNLSGTMAMHGITSWYHGRTSWSHGRPFWKWLSQQLSSLAT